MNALTKTFNFQDDVVRSAGTFERPIFCVRDICKALGIKNVGNKVAVLDKDEKDNIHVMDAIGRTRNVPACTEPGLYNILLSCNKNEKTRSFRRWVCHEVLPSIRKTGRYENQELMRQNAILKDTTKTQHNLIKALSKENRKYNIAQVLETDRASQQALTTVAANNFAKKFARDRGWRTTDLYDNAQRQELISEFRKRIVYDCSRDAVRFVC